MTRSWISISVLLVAAGLFGLSAVTPASAKPRHPIYAGYDVCVGWCVANRTGAQHVKCVCNCVSYYGKSKPPECQRSRK
jgi:predicted aminopeptidase